MRVSLDRCFLTLLIIGLAIASFAQDSSKYPLSLKFIQTTPSTVAATNAQTQTNCTPVPGTQQINCNSRQIAGGTHTTFISTVEASDGNTYEITCIQGAGARFLAGGSNAVRAQSGLPTYSGCQMQPGTYQARWDKNKLKVLLYNSNGKRKEVTFEILASARTATTAPSPVAPPIKQPLPPSDSLSESEQLSKPDSAFTHNRFTENGRTFSQEGNNIIADCMDNNDVGTTTMLCTGYIEGISDLLSETNICISPEVPAEKLREVVMQYASKHQDLLHRPASVVVSVALQESFPCSTHPK